MAMIKLSETRYELISDDTNKNIYEPQIRFQYEEVLFALMYVEVVAKR